MHTPEVPPLFLADHPVLDFLNTIAAPEGSPIDVLQADSDVLYWLERARMAPAKPSVLTRGSLLTTARSLREAIRPLVLKRKTGKRADASALNAFLIHAVSHPQILWESASAPHIERYRPVKTPEQILAPVAESAAEFLATADFDLVRPCEGKDCILWFYDRTKSHRRRWCSMSICGNRHKVEAFRERRRG